MTMKGSPSAEEEAPIPTDALRCQWSLWSGAQAMGTAAPAFHARKSLLDLILST